MHSCLVCRARPSRPALHGHAEAAAVVPGHGDAGLPRGVLAGTFGWLALVLVGEAPHSPADSSRCHKRVYPGKL